MKKKEEFNEYWDDTFGDFRMAAYSLPRQRDSFNVDKKAYIDELNSYKTEGPPETMTRITENSIEAFAIELFD